MKTVAVLLMYVTVCGAGNGARQLSQTCTQDRSFPACCNVQRPCQSGLCRHVGHGNLLNSVLSEWHKGL